MRTSPFPIPQHQPSSAKALAFPAPSSRHKGAILCPGEEGEGGPASVAPEPVVAVRQRSRQPACHAGAPRPRIAGAKLYPCASLERTEPLLPSEFSNEEWSPPVFLGADSPGTLSSTTVRTSSLTALGW